MLTENDALTERDHAVEANDPAKRNTRASERIDMGPYEAYAVHTKDGRNRWRLIDKHCYFDDERPSGPYAIRIGETFEQVARDFREFIPPNSGDL